MVDKLCYIAFPKLSWVTFIEIEDEPTNPESIITLGVTVNIVLLILVAVILVVNVKATWILVRSSYYDARQKLFQLVLVWLIPILGAILVWSLATDSAGKRVTTDLSDRFGNSNDGDVRLDNYSSEGGGDGH